MRFRTSTALALALSIALYAAGHADEPNEAAPIFPAEVLDLDGDRVNLQEMARTSTVVVVTLKATWCPVCRNQLKRIKESNQALEDCGVSVVVLAPGPREELSAIRNALGVDFPFIEDRGLEIARSLGLQLSADEIAPAILMLNRDLSVGWVQQGRNSSYYGDCELMKEIACWEKIQI